MNDETVVPFPTPDEERARRLKIEVERLARLPTVEWMYYVAAAGYAERYGVDGATLKTMVEAVVKANEKKAREDRGELRRREDRVEKKRDAAEREVERKVERRTREEERRLEREAREEERREREERKAAERKARETQKALAAIVKLPSVEHEVELQRAARRLGATTGEHIPRRSTRW